MGIGKHREKSFVWDDVHLSTTFSISNYRTYAFSPLHSHPHYEMFLIESGDFVLGTENGKVKYTKNTVVIVPPNTEHNTFSSEDSHETKIMGLSFKFRKLSEHGKSRPNKLYSYFSAMLPSDNGIVVLKDKYFGNFCHRFSLESESDPTLASFVIVNLIEELFLHILRMLKHKYDKTNSAPIYSYKSSAITSDVILSKNIEDYMNVPGCTLTLLAKKLNMCPRNTQKIIKKIFGKSFSEKMAETRLKKAVYLIENTDLLLTDVARAVNYNQYASFRKAFIAYYGISPSKYKQGANIDN